jgi:HEAT repeat protein
MKWLRRKDRDDREGPAAPTPPPVAEDWEPFVRGKPEDPKVASLAAELQAGDEARRYRAAKALLELDAQPSMDPVRLDEGGIGALQNAAWAARNDDPDLRRLVFEVLVTGLEHKRPRVRVAAAATIHWIFAEEGPDDVVARTLVALLVYVDQISGPAADVLEGLGDAAGAPLIAMAREGSKAFDYPDDPLLDSEDEERGRGYAVTTLWRRVEKRGVADPGAFECFVEALNDKYEGVRWQAVNGLKRLKDPRAVQALEGVLDDESDVVRDEAASLIKELRGDSHEPVRAPESEEGSEVVRSSGGSVQEELLNFLALTDRQRRLLEVLAPLPEESARAAFARVGVENPNKYVDHMSAFSSFRSAAMTSEGSPIQTRYLRLDDSSSENDFLYVHLGDEVLPVGLLICALREGGFLGYYEAGSDLEELGKALEI